MNDYTKDIKYIRENDIKFALSCGGVYDAADIPESLKKPLFNGTNKIKYIEEELNE